MDDYTVHVPLELDLIEEGHFVENINKALSELQIALINHKRQYKHKAEKAKAKLTVEIVLMCVDPENDSYASVVQIKKALPPAPATATLLMEGNDAFGKRRLLCRKSGSSQVPPAQKILCTEDGSGVDKKTGEILNADADSAIEEIVGQEQQEE